MELSGLPLLLGPELIRPPDGDVLGSEVAKGPLEALFDNVAPDVVQHHHRRHGQLEGVGELDQLELLVDLRDELGGAGEGDAGDEHQAPVHAAVLADPLAERAALVVDREGGDLLDELQEVDGAVQERRLEFAFEVDFLLSRFRSLHVV